MANETNDLAGLIQPFVMIVISEVGDNTFLTTTILAMRHSRIPVFVGAFSSLVIMSILSSALGHLLPTLILRRWTQIAASAIFFIFGVKMLIEALRMKAGNENMKEEMREVEEEIEKDDAVHAETRLTSATFPMHCMEDGECANRPGDSVAPQSPRNSRMKDARRFCNSIFGPVFVQAFVLTFLGEWGSRSQIATIVLGGAHNVYLVVLGTIAGHSLCIALAVLGGKYISTKLSIKHVTFGSALLFLVFGALYMYEAFDMSGVTIPFPDPIGGDVPAL